MELFHEFHSQIVANIFWVLSCPLLNLFTIEVFFLKWIPWDFFTYKITSSANKDTFTSSFPVGILLCISALLGKAERFYVPNLLIWLLRAHPGKGERALKTYQWSRRRGCCFLVLEDISHHTPSHNDRKLFSWARSHVLRTPDPERQGHLLVFL